MKKWQKIFVGVAAVGAICYGLYGGESDMKFVNTKSGFVLVEFIDHEPHFYDPLLEKEMREIGIAIPLVYRDAYHQKERVFLGDPDFEKAFRELFTKFQFSAKNFKWESVDSE